VRVTAHRLFHPLAKRLERNATAHERFERHGASDGEADRFLQSSRA
jgi:hypothetical protein